MNSKSKGSVVLIIILVLIALILAGGIGYGYYWWQSNRNPSPSPSPTPTPDETAGWHVFTNSTHHYQIKYPSNWYYHTTGYAPPPPTTVMFASMPEDELTGNYVSMMISALPAEGETLDENAEIQNLVAEGYSKNSMTLSGQPAIKLGNTGQPQSGGLIYCLYNDEIYRLSWGATTKELFLAYQDTIGKMIDSFTFTDSRSGEIDTNVVSLGDTATIQQSVDNGHQPWRLDPLEVARADGTQYGFSSSDQFTLVSSGYNENAGTYLAEVDAVHNGSHYTIQLIQPETQGSGGIWAINSIRLAS